MGLADPDRRAFLRGSFSRRLPVAIRPPWSLPPAEFADTCEACDECIRVCPESILRRGDGGLPEVDFSRGECTFCGRCADTCRFNAFDPESRRVEEAWNLSVHIAPACLSLNGVVCRTCGDRCDARAIRFQLQTRAVAAPMIQADECTGCGACVAACPVNAVSIKQLESMEAIV